jgi:hypothetical protein
MVLKNPDGFPRTSPPAGSLASPMYGTVRGPSGAQSVRSGGLYGLGVGIHDEKMILIERVIRMATMLVLHFLLCGFLIDLSPVFHVRPFSNKFAHFQTVFAFE